MAAAEQASFIAALSSDRVELNDLSGADRALVTYAEKLTREPAAVDAADIERLRAAGFDDRAIHDLCAIVAYFAFVNRIADGLGVELEESRG
jgi:uncharacterized peroxidase-related enzyme